MLRLIGMGLLVAVLAGCSGNVEFSFGGNSPAEAAVDLIESDEMAQRLGLDPITDAVCEDPPVVEEGAVFPCTGMSQDKAVDFEVLIEPEDRIFAGPTNVVSATFLENYETSAISALNAQNDFTLAADAMDCGTESFVLDDDRALPCTLTDGGQTYDAVLTVTDVAQGTFDVEIVGTAE